MQCNVVLKCFGEFHEMHGWPYDSGPDDAADLPGRGARRRADAAKPDHAGLLDLATAKTRQRGGHRPSVRPDGRDTLRGRALFRREVSHLGNAAAAPSGE